MHVLDYGQGKLTPNTAGTSLRHALSGSQGGLVGLPLRGVRVFKRFAQLQVGSAKMASSSPAHHYP